MVNCWCVSRNSLNEQTTLQAADPEDLARLSAPALRRIARPNFLDCVRGIFYEVFSGARLLYGMPE